MGECFIIILTSRGEVYTMGENTESQLGFETVNINLYIYIYIYIYNIKYIFVLFLINIMIYILNTN